MPSKSAITAVRFQQVLAELLDWGVQLDARAVILLTESAHVSSKKVVWGPQPESTPAHASSSTLFFARSVVALPHVVTRAIMVPQISAQH